MIKIHKIWKIKMLLFHWIEHESNSFLGKIVLIEKKRAIHSSRSSYTSTDGERMRLSYFQDEKLRVRRRQGRTPTSLCFVFANIVKNDIARLRRKTTSE